VLGLDPGSRHFGWGVIRREGARLFHVAHGVVDVDDGRPLALRLVDIEAALDRVIELHGPVTASVESIFFAKDAQAAAKLGHARGVALLVCARARLDVFEYPPARVKRAVAGNGRADKAQVAQMVRVLLGLAAAPRADAADALAAAITHLQSSRELMGAPAPRSASRRAIPKDATPAQKLLHALMTGKSAKKRGIPGR
jgi:crossover junction endodeoxyribonuclease RuvC